jgi:hypothetical protein
VWFLLKVQLSPSGPGVGCWKTEEVLAEIL